MLIKRAVLDRITAGQVTLAFRRWKRPTVRPGGRLRTAIGVLGIESVDRVSEAEIEEADAQRAGFASRAALLEDVSAHEGDLYRISLRLAEEDPRKALRANGSLSKSERIALAERLDRFDRASRNGPWSRRTLELIAAYPGTAAGVLARELGVEHQAFKRNVRKLKELGLTESLDIGYRLSPRGRALLVQLG
jgi:hypothetical protein